MQRLNWTGNEINRVNARDISGTKNNLQTSAGARFPRQRARKEQIRRQRIDKNIKGFKIFKCHPNFLIFLSIQIFFFLV